ncbi:MAG: tyrosine-type recombinase/integrase [Alcaligenaceae bacterium]
MANPIDSKTKRERLKPRREPYWAMLEKYVALGYRKPETGTGTWIARRLDENGKKLYHALGTHVSFDCAAKAAREWLALSAKGIDTTAITVKAATDAYVLALEDKCRTATAKDARGRFKRLVDAAPIGRVLLSKLTSVQVRKWLNDQINKDEDADDEDVRRSKDSANRNLANLKAALALAHANRLVGSDDAWAVVKPFSKVGARRKEAFLSMEARTALLAACPADLATLLKAALLTGARPGELANLKVADFNKTQSVLTLRGKTGARTVAISTAAANFFTEASQDKTPAAPLLATSYGQAWNKDSWKKPFKDAVTSAKLPEAVVLYSLRHTAISEMIMGGMDSFWVAKLTGTSVAMIEKNYGHLNHDVVTAKLDKVRRMY